MMTRKIWVKRPDASATLVRVTDDDVVDEVRDSIIRKYANSLGRTFDAPDVVLRIVPREKSQPSANRILSPDEPVWPLLESYYPGGQAIEEALLIDIPPERTPRASPRNAARETTVSFYEDNRPVENGTDYFPPMPAVVHPPTNMPLHEMRQAYHPMVHPHSISVVETGHLPALSSPLAREARERRQHQHQRPRVGRQHTSSPTIMTATGPIATSALHHTPRQARPHLTEAEMKHTNNAPLPPPLPTPPASENNAVPHNRAGPSSPLDRASSPRPTKSKAMKKSPATKNNKQAAAPRPADSLDNSVPPINVLIVEDNIINLKLLEQMVKRLKVRWQTAMNGRDAVTKWRGGGFHLVLMDIQMPIMNGLDATKEIRRLERVNGIGVFAKTEEEQRGAALMAAHAKGRSTPAATIPQVDGDDKLAAGGVFRSPVIIVALTASSLQSDRHEALAAGCNDFLTKPVDNEWFERKIMEWGCMQALIDFDGWRKWKEDSERAERETRLDPEAKAKQEKRDAKMAAKAALLAKMAKS